MVATVQAIGYFGIIHTVHPTKYVIPHPKIPQVLLVKGTVQRDFYLRFFHEWAPSEPLTRYLKAFKFGSDSRRYFRFLIDNTISIIE